MKLNPLVDLFVNYGFKSSEIGNINWGLELNRHKIIVNDEASQVGREFAFVETAATTDDLIATGLGDTYCS